MEGNIQENNLSHISHQNAQINGIQKRINTRQRLSKHHPKPLPLRSTDTNISEQIGDRNVETANQILQHHMNHSRKSPRPIQHTNNSVIHRPTMFSSNRQDTQRPAPPNNSGTRKEKNPHTTPVDLNLQQKEQKPTNTKTAASNQHCE